MAERDHERGRQIQALRRAAGYRSAEKAAQVAGVSHRTFQNWEGGGDVKAENLPGLAKVLKLDRAAVRAMFPEPQVETPDFIAALEQPSNGRNSVLALESKLDRALAEITKTQVEQATRQAELAEAVQQMQQQIEALSRQRKNRPGS